MMLFWLGLSSSDKIDCSSPIVLPRTVVALALIQRSNLKSFGVELQLRNHGGLLHGHARSARQDSGELELEL